MDRKNLKVGKKGGAKKVTNKLKQVREAPLSRNILHIVDESSKSSEEKPLKKTAAPRADLET